MSNIHFITMKKIKSMLMFILGVKKTVLIDKRIKINKETED